MKKVYALIVVLTGFAYPALAQTFYWIGPNNGSWTDGSNWSLTSGGTPAGDYPQHSVDDAVFNTNASVILNASIDLNTLDVSVSAINVTITGTGGVDRIITAYGSTLAAPAIRVAAGSVLQHSAQNDTWLRFVFANNARGEINGEWFFGGNINNNAIASYDLGSPGFTTRLNVNSGGSIAVGVNGFIEPNELTGDQYLVFHPGSRLRLLGNGPVVPVANYAASSTIEITGVTNASVVFEEAGSVGNITYNSPAQSNGVNPLYLSLLTFAVNGDLNILGTNNNELTIINFNSTSGMTSRDATIAGNLNIQGNSVVSVARNDGQEFTNNLTVGGNVIMNGTALYLHSGTFISTRATTLRVGGNIQHTAGVLSTSSTRTSHTNHLYVIEMNGSSAQTISSHNGTFDNAQNQVTLRMNNAAGVSLLTNLSVGRLSFNSPNRGIINTNSNILTINNNLTPSFSPIILEMPANPSQGYVIGTVRRRVSFTEPFLMPVGAAGAYRGITLQPLTSTFTIFEATYIPGTPSGTLTAPVRGIANFQWQIQRVGSGSSAAVILNIPGAIPGALAGYDIAVGRYDGSNWVTTRGSGSVMVSPGTSTSGTVRSSMLNSFGNFTISLESDNALPTYLLSFEARKLEKETAQLMWEVTDNSTPEYFEIMRSGDGAQFSAIGRVSSGPAQRKFNFTDDVMLPGTNYYRLRMVDKDGSITQSAIRMIARNVEGFVLHSLTPTMVQTSARARISAIEPCAVQLVITDVSGRMIQRRQVSLSAGTQDIHIDAGKLPPGAYQFTAYLPKGNPITIRFIKL